jgi:hypothetical protein
MDKRLQLSLEKELSRRFGWKDPDIDFGLLIAELAAIKFMGVPDPDKTAKMIVDRTIEKLPPEIIARGETHIKDYFNNEVQYLDRRQLMLKAATEIKRESDLR